MTQTPLQKATAIVIGSYKAALRTLTPAEADALRDILCAAIARDYLEALGTLGAEERAA
jgi:hypothetical protein